MKAMVYICKIGCIIYRNKKYPSCMKRLDRQKEICGISMASDSLKSHNQKKNDQLQNSLVAVEYNTRTRHCHYMPLTLVLLGRSTIPSESSSGVSPSKLPSASGFCLDLEILRCQPSSTGMKCHRSNSGHITSKKTISVSSWHCQSKKSLSRATPDVRTSMSSGGLFLVNMWSDNVWREIVSGDTNAGPSASAASVTGVESLALGISCGPRWRVVDEEKEDPDS